MRVPSVDARENILSDVFQTVVEQIVFVSVMLVKRDLVYHRLVANIDYGDFLERSAFQ